MEKQPISINLGRSKNQYKEPEAIALSSGFNTFFREKIAPEMNDIEKKRFIYLFFYCLSAFICVFFISFVTVFLIVCDRSPELLILFILGASAFAALCKKIKNGYKNAVKEQIMNKNLSYLGDLQLHLYPESYASDAIYNNLMLRQFTEEPEIDDVITGSYKDIPVEIIEVELKSDIKIPEKGNKLSLKAFWQFILKAFIVIAKVVAIIILALRGVRNADKIFREKQTVFKGLLLYFDFKRDYQTTVITRNREYLHPLNVGEDINLEDIEFNRIYQTSGYNQVEARILLKPAFMERLKELHYKGLKVACCFQGRHIIIAIETKKDMFELPFFKSTKNIKCYREIINQIEDVLSIIDTLKLAK